MSCCLWSTSATPTATFLVSDVAIFVLKRDAKLQLTNCYILTSLFLSYSCFGQVPQKGILWDDLGRYFCKLGALPVPWLAVSKCWPGLPVLLICLKS